MHVLVTGAAGFIGSAVANALLLRGDSVVGVDILNDYYDVGLKRARLVRLQSHRSFGFELADIAHREVMDSLFLGHRFDAVIHLAAQAGVRYSILNPHAYAEANLTGFMNILEGCRRQAVGHLVFASSSSVYGARVKSPFSEDDNVDHPVSLYAATKKANELMAHCYAHLYGIPCTGLRFFTVYGPWGRPDMAYFKFTRGILAGEALPVFNNGEMVRDFTYIDDIVEGVVGILDHSAEPDPKWDPAHPVPSSSSSPYRIYNLGNNHPVGLMHFIGVLEACLGKKAILEFLPMQPGDVPVTAADMTAIDHAIGFRPSTSIETGISRFVDWYREYYKV